VSRPVGRPGSVGVYPVVTPLYEGMRFYASTVGDSSGAGSTGVALDALLLEAKLSVPEPRSGTVSRVGLIDRARASGCRVVGVTAPAGYGKSTLLAEWALAEDRRVAWVSLDRFDDDPAVLVSLLASAYARVWSGIR
jgi:LuxR family transcriptional regulator, maltose regulon positive regulatory protein